MNLKEKLSLARDFIPSVLENRDSLATLGAGILYEMTYLKPFGRRLIRDLEIDTMQGDLACIALLQAAERRRDKVESLISDPLVVERKRLPGFSDFLDEFNLR